MNLTLTEIQGEDMDPESLKDPHSLVETIHNIVFDSLANYWMESGVLVVEGVQTKKILGTRRFVDG